MQGKHTQQALQEFFPVLAPFAVHARIFTAKGAKDAKIWIVHPADRILPLNLLHMQGKHTQQALQEFFAALAPFAVHARIFTAKGAKDAKIWIVHPADRILPLNLLHMQGKRTQQALQEFFAALASFAVNPC